MRRSIDALADEDWFRFEVTAPERVRVRIAASPADYELELYLAEMLVATGTPRGKAHETIDRELEPGSYRVRVRAPGGVEGKKADYRLRLSDGSDDE